MSITHPWQGHFMEPAFLGFVSYASKHHINDYIDECGPVNLANDTIGMMIDQSTGRAESETQRFIDWCVSVFGTPQDITPALGAETFVGDNQNKPGSPGAIQRAQPKPPFESKGGE